MLDNVVWLNFKFVLNLQLVVLAALIDFSGVLLVFRVITQAPFSRADADNRDEDNKKGKTRWEHNDEPGAGAATPSFAPTIKVIFVALFGRF